MDLDIISSRSLIEYIINPFQSWEEPFTERQNNMDSKIGEMQEKLCRLDGLETKVRQMEEGIIKMEALDKILNKFFTQWEILMTSLSATIQGNATARNVENETPRNPADANAVVSQMSARVMRAAKLGDTEVMKCLLSNGANVICFDHVYETPLHYSARMGNTEMMMLLLNACNTTVLVHNALGQTALMIAALVGNKRNVELLLSYRSVLDQKDRNGATPLWYAASAGKTEIVKLLISKGADMIFDTQPQTSVLDVAAKYGHGGTVAEILTLTRWTSDEYKNALDATNSGEVVLAIARHIPHQFWNIVGTLSVISAAQNGRVNALDALLRAGANPYYRNLGGMTPLHFAASHGNLPVLATLVMHNVSLEAVDSKGRTPLHLAAIHGKAKAVQALVAKGANVAAVDNRGRTPALATKYGYIREILAGTAEFDWTKIGFRE